MLADAATRQLRETVAVTLAVTFHLKRDVTAPSKCIAL